jgi:hypothetical protein
LQQQVHKLFFDQEKTIPYFATKYDKVLRQTQRNNLEGTQKYYVCMDFKRYDLTHVPQSKWNLRRAVSELCDYSEGYRRQQVFCAIANIFAPILTDWIDDQPVFQWRAGIATSGAGDFAGFNSIFALAVVMEVMRQSDRRFKNRHCLDFKSYEIGMGLGDNTYLPTDVGAQKLGEHVAKYGLQLKASECMRSKRWVVMLKNLFDVTVEGGLSPVIMSYAHKALCPPFTDLSWKYFKKGETGWFCRKGRHIREMEYKVAISSRARAALVKHAVEDYGGSNWRKIWELWMKRITPKAQMMSQLIDKELAAQISILTGSEKSLRDSEFVKSRHRIRDLMDYIDC